MIRALTLINLGCVIAGIALLTVGDDNQKVVAVVLFLIAIAISFLLGIRRAFHKVRDVVSDARGFVSGEIQNARLVRVEDPKGWFSPESEIELQLQGSDGVAHSFQRDVPVPFPVAWSYRLGKRFNLPLLGGTDLSKLMATELRREGMAVSVGRGGD